MDPHWGLHLPHCPCSWGKDCLGSGEILPGGWTVSMLCPFLVWCSVQAGWDCGLCGVDAAPSSAGPPADLRPHSQDWARWPSNNLPPSLQDGDKFWRMPECYIRGSTIKYLRIPDEIIDMVKEEVVAKGRGRGGLQQQKQQKGRGMGGAGRGVFGGRGRGGIPGTGRGQPEKKPGRQAGKQ
uniref:LSM4 homolog, U6 small nuclear RNA and mRNA degradation associated n=1 Tax=Callithrix jacchus TaxID=9483 RepID=A0A8I3X438_CALJA